MRGPPSSWPDRSGGAGADDLSPATRTATAPSEAMEGVVHLTLLGWDLPSEEGTELLGLTSHRRQIPAFAARRPPPTARSRGRQTQSTPWMCRTSTPGVLQLLPYLFQTWKQSQAAAAAVRLPDAKLHRAPAILNLDRASCLRPPSTWIVIASTSNGC